VTQIKKPAMRRAILRAAAKLFRADGCTGTSLARVARRSPAPTSMSISAASWIFCLPWPGLACCGVWQCWREMPALPSPREKLRRLFTAQLFGAAAGGLRHLQREGPVFTRPAAAGRGHGGRGGARRRLGAGDSRLPAMVELMCDLLAPQA